MEVIYILFIIAIIVICLIKIIEKTNGYKREPQRKESAGHIDEPTTINKEYLPYLLTESIFTSKESAFFHSLHPIVKNLDLMLFAKMRVADLVYVPKGHPEYMKWFNNIRSKHIDFIICEDLKPVLLIELDDYTHDRAKNKQRDEFKNEIFSQLGIPLLRFRKWSEDDLEYEIRKVLGYNKKVEALGDYTYADVDDKE
jgi:hypothetical protein